MKQLFTFQWRMLLLLVMLTGFTLEGYSQCDNFTYEITAKDSPCGQNGGITIQLNGPDVTGANPTFSDLQYRVYITGTDPTDVAYVNNNKISNLAPGKYTVEVLGKCLSTGGYIPKLLASNTEVKQLGGWASLEMSAVKVTESLSCLDSGVLRFYNFKGGTVSWKLEIVEAPVEYTGATVLYDAATRPTIEILAKNLPKGAYKIRFTEGSECASAVEVNYIIGGLTGMPLPFFNTTLYPGQLGAQYPLEADSYYCDRVTLRKNTYIAGNEPFLYFINNWEDYFEYAFYYDGDDISDPSTLTWASCVKGDYLWAKGLRYSVSKMHEGAVYIPRFLIRVKGCTETINFIPIANLPYPVKSTKYANCGIAKTTIYPYTDEDGLICYPYTWKAVKVEGTVETLVKQSTAPVPYSGSSIILDSLTTGSYKIYITDANGYVMTRQTTWLVKSSTAVDNMYLRSQILGCGEQEIPQIYRMTSITNETLKALTRVKYIKSDKWNITTNRWETDNSYPAPNFPDIDVAAINKDSLNKYHSSGTITPWAKTLDNTINPCNYSDPSIYADLYRNKTTPVTLGPRDYYKHYFEITDTCGVTRSFDIPLQQNYFEHVATPETRIERSCTQDNINIFIPNIASLIKSYSRQAGTEYPFTPYVNVVEKPVGASVTYKQASPTYNPTSVRYDTDWIQVNKPGRYVIVVAANYYTNTNNPSKIADLCGQTYEIIIPEVLQFELDKSNTIAYRCKNSGVGEGYIEIKTKNGMGPFVFELWNADKTVKLQTNDTGKFTGWPLTVSDEYVVIAYDYGCAPERIVSFQQNIQVYDLDNTPVAWTDRPRVCVGDEIHLFSLALGETPYNWTLVSPSGATWSYTGRTPVITNATLDMTGSYQVTVAVPYCPGLTITGSVEISVAERLMYWNPEAVDTNWYNTNNWLDKDGNAVEFVPASCTNVHIPGNADHYPNLYVDSTPWSEFGYPSCDTIIYHYGAETAFPIYLMYNKAIVQYNWGHYDGDFSISGIPGSDRDEDYPNNGFREITRMPRAKWNMISAPLKKMTGGDFGLAGYPNLYQRLFNTPSPETGVPAQDDFTTTFSKYTIDLTTSNSALALWVADYDTWVGAKDHKNLEGLKGIIEMPYFNNSEIAPFRPLNKYDPATSTSTYYYYNNETLKPEMDQFDEFVRGDESYRFVYEGNNLEAEKILRAGEYVHIYRMPMMSAQTGSRIMIGNPMMCHIDFDKLYALNSTIINNHYQITEASTGNTLTYRMGMPGNSLEKDIAPLQGFIISRKNPKATEELIFQLDGNEAVIANAANGDPLPKPRASKLLTQGWVLLDGVTPATASSNGKEIAVRTNLYFNFSGESIDKSYHPDGLDERAEMFFIDDANKTNTDQMQNETPQPPVVRFGLISKFTKDIKLKFTVGGTLVKTAKLVDKYLNKEQDILANPVYVFQHRYSRVESGRTGLDTDRFELRLTYNEDSTVGVGENAGDYFAVSCRNKKLSVISTKQIETLKVANLAGIVILDENVQTTRYEKHIDLATGTYIVEVTLADGETKSKKIIIR